MSIDCPDPPTSAIRVDIKALGTLAAGTRLYRFHPFVAPDQYHGHSFNPGSHFDWTKDVDGARFSPFPRSPPVLAPSGKLLYVPSNYSAEHPEVAALESVFHDPGAGASPGFTLNTLLRKNIHLSTLMVTRPLQVIELGNGSLRQVTGTSSAGLDVTIEEGELLHCHKAQYPITRQWAKLLFEGVPTAAGFRYHSRMGGGWCYVLFEDRAAGALDLVGGPTPLSDKSALEVIRSAALRGHIALA